MSGSRWERIDLPVLQVLADREERGIAYNFLSIAEQTGLLHPELSWSLQRLEAAEYVRVGPRLPGTSAAGVGRPYVLDERGLRTVGAWPADDTYQALLDVLARLEGAAEPREQGKLKAVRDALLSAGRDITVGVITELAKRGLT